MPDDLPEQVTLWRCAGPCCGKWSFAKRRPTHHKRLIRGLKPDGEEGGEPCTVCEPGRTDGRTRFDAQEQAADWELPTVEVHEERSGTSYGPMAGEPHLLEPVEDWYEPERVTVKCGPFVEYTATLRAQWHDDQRAREHASALSAESMDLVPLATDTITFGPGHQPGGTREELAF